jgi:hypothetical protein
MFISIYIHGHLFLVHVHSFDIHDGDDYIQVNDELEDKVLEFFEKVGDKLKQNMV